ncbi:MAG: twin-arginine translocase subunit TatC [Lentisphaeria bacterium]|nr:twin-arginine translocase subunit TatC [Lentisphaeria bacterium]
MEEMQDIRFLEHLEQLRRVLIKILGFTAFAALPCWFLAPYILDFLLSYAAPAGFKLHYFSLMEPFLVRLKITCLLAVVITLPLNGFLLWNFIAPGLLEDERKAVRGPAVFMALLALGGTALSAFLVIPALIRFSLTFAGENMQPVIGIGDFTDLVLTVLLAGMILFQFPVVLYFLLWLGILDVAAVKDKRPLMIVLIFVAAAVLSPPDAFSQIVLAVPAWLLFELSLWFFSRRFAARDRSYDEIYKDIE